MNQESEEAQMQGSKFPHLLDIQPPGFEKNLGSAPSV